MELQNFPYFFTNKSRDLWHSLAVWLINSVAIWNMNYFFVKKCKQIFGKETSSEEASNPYLHSQVWKKPDMRNTFNILIMTSCFAYMRKFISKRNCHHCRLVVAESQEKDYSVVWISTGQFGFLYCRYNAVTINSLALPDKLLEPRESFLTYL